MFQQCIDVTKLGDTQISSPALGLVLGYTELAGFSSLVDLNLRRLGPVENGTYILPKEPGQHFDAGGIPIGSMAANLLGLSVGARRGQALSRRSDQLFALCTPEVQNYFTHHRVRCKCARGEFEDALGILRDTIARLTASHEQGRQIANDFLDQLMTTGQLLADESTDYRALALARQIIELQHLSPGDGPIFTLAQAAVKHGYYGDAATLTGHLIAESARTDVFASVMVHRAGQTPPDWW
jgi:hypothetical protein